MITKRFFLIFLFTVFVYLGLSGRAPAHAAVKYVDRASPLVVAANSCQGRVTDSAYALMTLPVTEELAAELNALIANGETPGIAVRSQVEFLASGSGSAGYQGQIEVYIDRADGNRIELGSFTEQHTSNLLITMENVTISKLTTDVMPGDNITVEVTGQGFADAGGCEPADQASLSWQIAAAPFYNEPLPSDFGL